MKGEGKKEKKVIKDDNEKGVRGRRRELKREKEKNHDEDKAFGGKIATKKKSAGKR